MSASGISSDLAGRASGGRRLIAVVYADMVGYSRLISLDDAGTLRRLRTLRLALIDPAVHEHGGRIVQTGGDSLLVAFDSIDGAVRCAVKVQKQVPAYDGDQQADRRIRFRVGIDMGDAIPDGTDLHGDAVNIAARLEVASPVGGICVSRPVRDYVHGRLDLAFEAVGELSLKNIARPVEAFVLRLDPDAKARPATATTQLKQPGPRHRLRSALTIAATALVVTCAGATGWWWSTGIGPNVVKKAPEPASLTVASQAPQPTAAKAAMPMEVGLANASQLSVVVLPFNNLGGEGVDEDTVDGITEDLTTDLSRVPSFLVIARNSAFTYKAKPIDIKRVGGELGVRYAVEGSARKVEGTLRVNVQLVSTETGTHLWAERFDIRRDGVGYGVDDIVRQIAFALSGHIVDTEAGRNLRERPANPDVADILLRARSVYNRPLTPQRQDELVALYERAIGLDPNSAAALAGLADALLDSFANIEDPTNPERERRAEELIKRAELLRPDHMAVMWTRVYLLGRQDRCPELMVAAQRAVEVHPALTGPLLWRGICLMRMGRPAEAIPELEQAIRMNPRSPGIENRYLVMGYALLFSGRYDEAIVWFQRALAANPNAGAWRRGIVFAAIAGAQALAGYTERARSSAAEAGRLWPAITVRSYFPFNIFQRSAEAHVSRLHDGLRLAGIRDHADEDADSGLASDSILHTNYEATTPATVPGAQTIRTPDLARVLELRKPLVLDTFDLGRSVPDAIALSGAGIGGGTSDQFQDRLGRKIQQLTRGDLTLPIIAMGFNSERYQGRNLALRLVALGYTNVFWYRGGREAWEAAGLPEADLVVQDW